MQAKNALIHSFNKDEALNIIIEVNPYYHLGVIIPSSQFNVLVCIQNHDKDNDGSDHY